MWQDGSTFIPLVRAIYKAIVLIYLKIEFFKSCPLKNVVVGKSISVMFVLVEMGQNRNDQQQRK